MPLTVKHAKVSGIADSGNATLVEPSDWNASHVLTGGLGDTFYISSAGNDSNSGLTPAASWLTITKVNAQTPTPGTTFLFRGGDTFSGALVAAASGSASLPITYGSYSDHQSQGVSNPPNAIISSGNSAGFTSTDFSWITVQSLTFTGSGPATNTNHGAFFTGLTVNGSGISLLNCIINGYGFNGVYCVAGSNPTPVVVWDTWNINGNTVYNCGQNGIQFATGNAPGGTTNSLAFSRVTVQNNTIFSITGQASIFGGGSFCGGGIAVQGCDDGLVQNNLVHDCGSQCGSAGFSNNPGLYCASNSNMTWQYNEVYNITQVPPGGASMTDCGAMTADFGNHYILIQYNYFHDCAAYGIASFGSNFGGVTNINGNITFRYNIIANCGTQNGGATLPSGIVLGPLFAGQSQEVNMFYHNNTIYSVGLNQGPLWFSGLGTETNCVLYNNLVICDGKGLMGVHATNTPVPFLINNAYIGASPVTAGQDRGSNYATVTTWLNALGAEILNGAQQTILTGPTGTAKLTGPEPIITAPMELFGGINANVNINAQSLNNPAASAAKFSLLPQSPYNGAGFDAYTLLPADLLNPTGNPFGLNLDFDFKGQTYNGGGGLTDITCTRASILATDLMPDDPMGRAFNTFGANTLRITAGRGLLVEELRHQYLTTPGTPATQTTPSLASGSNFVLWVNGPGTAVVTAASGTPVSREAILAINGIVAAHGRPAPFSMSSTGTVTVTVFGTLNQFQLESDPQGTSRGTSFITAPGDRDADVVTSTGGTGFGGNLIAHMLAGTGMLLAWLRFPYVYGFSYLRTIISDNSNTSSIYIQSDNNFNSAVSKLGSLIVKSASQYPPLPKAIPTCNPGFQLRSTLAVSADPTTGQLVSANGETFGVSATTASPSPTSPVHIGNDVTGLSSLNGYIERIALGAAGLISAASLQNSANIIPIGAINGFPPASKDFFGNPVPGAVGTYSIGAHQPQVPPNTALLNVADQLVTGGANVTDLGLATGNVTIDCGARPLQSITNGGAFTITAPANDGSCMVLITNNSLAGAVTFSGFSVGSNTGDALTTTNTNKFTVSIWRVNSISGYRIAAHQ